MLLVAFFFSLIIFVSSPKALAVDVDQLEDLTGGVVPVVTFEGHDTFTNEYVYSVRVINQTGDSLVAGMLFLVLSEVQDLSGKDVLGSLEVPNQSEEHTSELQSQSHISYAVFCLKKKKQ